MSTNLYFDDCAAYIEAKGSCPGARTTETNEEKLHENTQKFDGESI